MAKKEEGYNVSDLGNWNVAKEYSHFKIMKNLYLADEYSNIAIFGSSTILEELENPVSIEVLKLTGLSRLINVLILIIDNSLFAAKNGSSNQDLTDYRKTLKKILGIFDSAHKTIVRNKIQETKIIPKNFNKILDEVLTIKAGINEPLNKNHLIFTDKEEFDPKKYKEQVFQDATLKG